MNRKEIILKYALQNAVKYDHAEFKAVVSKVFSELKDVKDRKVLFEEVKNVISEVNDMKMGERVSKLMSIDPKLLEDKKEEKRELHELLNVGKNVVMRFAPNPNGAMSLGHSRQAILNWLYCEKYNGKYLLRFDDTDPKVKVPLKEAYDWFEEDLKWLGIKPWKVVRQSSRLKIYYKHAWELFKNKKAYVCVCDSEKKRKLLWKGKKCGCEENYDFEKFFEMKEGQGVVRIKTDLKNKNPAVRDWPAFRIVDKSEHPFEKKERVWPLLNFASAIDDHDFGITHIIRGIDLSVSDDRQKYLYEHFGWKYPETIYTGKLNVKGVKSTSQTKELIKSGKLKGWDDIRTGNLKSLRRRGFQADAIVNFIKDLGLNRNEVNVDLDNLYAYNRRLVEKSNRYFFIEDPKKIKIKDAPKMDVKIPLHPDNEKKGYREFKTSDEFYVQDKLEKDKMYRFMHLFNFANNKFISKDLDEKLKAKLIHWLPAEGNIKVEVLMDDGKIKKGLAESGVKKLKAGDVVQFERNFFCCLQNKENFVFWYLHR